jgi:adenosylmethionine-8-amino-7-oxononanoate aminotransferase
VLDRIAKVSEMQEQNLTALTESSSRFLNPRRIGTITAIDLDVADGGYLAAAGPALRAHFLEQGILLRPLGNTIYVMPPYCATGPDLSLVYEAIRSIP